MVLLNAFTELVIVGMLQYEECSLWLISDPKSTLVSLHTLVSFVCIVFDTAHVYVS